MKRAFVFLLFTVFLFTACKKTSSVLVPPQETQTQRSLDDMMAAVQTGGSIRCTMTKSSDQTVMNYAMKGKKIHVSGMKYEGKDVQSSMISDGEYMYIWQDDQTTGIKTKVPNEQETQELAKNMKKPDSVPDLSDINGRRQFEEQGYSINCNETSISDSEFVPPTTITFTDTSTLMQNALDAIKNIDQEKGVDAESIKKLQQQYGQQ